MQRAMTIFNRTDLLAHLRRQLVIDLYSHHGIAHWARVRANGLMLANDTGANLHVVELFAFFHDARRLSEHTDDGHGSRGAVLARRFKGRYFDATDDEVDLLQLACGRHSDGITRGDPTVMTCWDADRLDLGALTSHRTLNTFVLPLPSRMKRSAVPIAVRSIG